MGISLQALDRLLGSDPGRGFHFGLPKRDDPPPREVKENGEDSSSAEADLHGFRYSKLNISVQLHLERSVLDQAGQQIGFETLDVRLDYQRIDLETLSRESEKTPKGDETPSPMDKLLEHFGVEPTAQRIANFVTRGFGRTSFSEKDSAESRKSFIDFILPFIRQGAASALAMFGDSLPEEIKKQAEDTVHRVGELLNGFVAGSDEKQAA